MDWLINVADLGVVTFYEFTRGISWLLEIPLDFVTGVLATGLLSGEGSSAVQLTPPLPWVMVIIALALIGGYAKNWRLGLFVGACFTYLAVFGQWESAMFTFSSILIARPVWCLWWTLAGYLGLSVSPVLTS